MQSSKNDNRWDRDDVGQSLKPNDLIGVGSILGAAQILEQLYVDFKAENDDYHHGKKIGNFFSVGIFKFVHDRCEIAQLWKVHLFTFHSGVQLFFGLLKKDDWRYLKFLVF